MDQPNTRTADDDCGPTFTSELFRNSPCPPCLRGEKSYAGATRLLQHNHQRASVALDLAARCGLAFLDLLWTVDISGGLHIPSLLQRLGDEVAFAVDVRIDLMGDGVFFALVFLDANVVGAGSGPERLAVRSLEGRLPDAEMVALSDDFYGLCACVAIILTASEQIQRAHRDGYIGLLVQRRNERADDRLLIGLVGQHPIGALECRGDLFLA